MTNKESTNNAPPTTGTRTINIEGKEFTYSIKKMENEEGASIELSEAIPDRNITFTYKTTTAKLVKDIKVLLICENLEEIITSLEDIFDKSKITVEKKEEDKYALKIEALTYGKLAKYELELERNEPIDEKIEVSIKIKELEKKYKEIKEEICKLEKNTNANMILNEETKNILIKNIKEEIIHDKDIKEILFKEFEEKIYNKYIKKENEEKNEDRMICKKVEESVKKMNEICSNKVDEKVFNDNINKLKEDINNKINEIKEIRKNEENKEIDKYVNTKINENIKENKIIKNINEQINVLNEKNKDNYILMKVQIGSHDKGKDIPIIRQCYTYKLFKNFELEDIEVEIDGEKSPIKYKANHNSHLCKIFNYNEKEKDEIDSKKVYKELNNNYEFYWNFEKEGIYNIKIIFNKKLCSCAGLFYRCDNVIEIDMSKFDCTNVLSCKLMFYRCSKLKKINFGKLDFSLVTRFYGMFDECCNLVDLDVTNFNTKNSKSFSYMFSFCKNLKKIDVSKFNSSKCEHISYMFRCCYNITEIDMINWDISNLKHENEDNNINPISCLFCECKKLTKIKISGNIKEEEATKNLDGSYLFKDIPEDGEIITSKKVKCNIPLDGNLPQNWVRSKE